MFLNVSVDYEIDVGSSVDAAMDQAIEITQVFEVAVKMARKVLHAELLDDVLALDAANDRLVEFCRTGR